MKNVHIAATENWPNQKKLTIFLTIFKNREKIIKNLIYLLNVSEEVLKLYFCVTCNSLFS